MITKKGCNIVYKNKIPTTQSRIITIKVHESNMNRIYTNLIEKNKIKNTQTQFLQKKITKTELGKQWIVRFE